MRDISSVTDKQVREKLVAQGPSALSDAELLSILLRDGDAGDSAVGLAERLLAHFGGSLARMERCDLPALRMVGGLGIRRAAAVAAALELGRRLRIEEGQQIDSVRTDQDIVAMFQPQLGALPYEEFWAVYLNASNRVIDRMRVSQGGVSATVVADRQAGRRKTGECAGAGAQSSVGKRTAERRRQSPDRSGRSGGFAVRHYAARSYHRYGGALLQFPQSRLFR